MSGEATRGAAAPFDAGRHLVRARRRADLSQRELAALAGVSPSQVAALESGARRASADLLDRLLGLAGLRLAVLDEEGNEVEPVDVAVVRDRAGRRLPAHLDVQPSYPPPADRVASPRYDREPTVATYRLREGRDRLRDAGCRAPADHPTAGELEYHRLRRLYGRFSWWSRAGPALAEALGVSTPDGAAG